MTTGNVKSPPGSARVLVATGDVEDANQILRQLKNDFEHVRASTDPESAVQDFEEFKPDVLVLAFDTLEKAQRYYLGLYRLGQSLHQHLHRTVILCNKDEVRAVFELCKKQYFDDYVLYWPHTFDGPRLAMSIWMACREMTSARSDTPRPAELLVHVKHLNDLEETLARGFTDGEQQIAAARDSILEAERGLSRSVDEFSSLLAGGTSAGAVSVKDPAVLLRLVDQFKKLHVAQIGRDIANVIEPINEWARKLKDEIKPALSGTRVLSEKVRHIRPLMMVVEDDELSKLLVSRTLDGDAFEILFAADGPEALNQLRRQRPDIILMDIRLPGIDGVELTKRLKATPQLADIPIVMMTGDARRETLLRSIDAGAAAFVVKPFTRESLMSKVERFLPR